MPVRVQVKICGINSPAAIEAAAEAGADWVGFVFFRRSPRALTPEQAATLSARVPPPAEGGPERVGLFVDPTEREIAEALAVVRLNVLQLYADPPHAAALRARFAMRVWRSVGVSATADLPASLSGADALLLDGKPPPSASRPGGNARTWDWSMLAGWAAPGPWVLAGGLDAANVAEAIRASQASAVDVSSGVEAAPGIKEPALIRAFIAAARAA